jgi:hypothetical protein
MIFSKKWNMGLAIFGIFAGLLMVMALWGGPPTLAQTAFSFTIMQWKHQSTLVRDDAENVVGAGPTRGNATGDRDGQAARGRFEVEIDGGPTFKFDLGRIDEYTVDDDGKLIGIVVEATGERITPDNRQREPFETMVRVRADDTTGSETTLNVNAPIFGGVNVVVQGRFEVAEQR